jgi:DNA polymerase delta subunit 1
MDRLAAISSLYRGQIPFKFEDETLVFQALSWENEDQTINDEEETDDIPEEDNESKKKYEEKELIIRTYGLTKNGVSVCIEIKGFEPYFLLKIPPLWNKTKVKNLEFKILGMSKYHRKNISFEVVRMKKLYYFDNYTDHDFLKIKFKTDNSRWEMIRILIPPEKENIKADVIKIQKTVDLTLEGITYNLDVYESTMDTIIRFIHLSNIKPSGIIEIKSSKLKKTNTKTKCQITKSVFWKDVNPVNEEWVAPFRVSSFDIECSSGDGKFPQAERIDDKVIQIATTTRLFGEKYCAIRHIVTLKKSDNIPDIVNKNKLEFVIVESVNTEQELLALWARHVCLIDPDVMIGYNIFTFDWKYIYDRATLLKCVNKLSILGRLNKECKLKSQNLSSSAMGHNSLYYPLINGRIQIDLLPVIRSGHSLSSYKLNNVSLHFLNSSKDDLPPDQIFSRFNSGSPNDIMIIAKYCIQDCILVNDLFDKLDIFTNSLGMSNVCLVPINLLFTRGQGIKVFSKITKKCLERKTAFPTLVKQNYGPDDDSVGYEGAIVLEPIPGFYDVPIVVLDYGSLYPSSMIEYDISYETYHKSNENNETTENHRNNETNENHRNNTIEFDVDNGVKKCTYVENLKQKGILPSLLEDLLYERNVAKKLMEIEPDSFKKSVYNGKQLALKVTANSVYGYTGAKFSDLRFMDLAASTTAVGRLRINTARDIAQKKFEGSTVIYGDTDSIFIDVSKTKELKEFQDKSGKEALKASIALGQVMSKYITSQLREPQNLQYEKTFLPFMIISKKRYAGNKYEFDPDKSKFTSMGLVIKRRDNAPILKKIYKGILDIMFSNSDTSISVKKAVNFYKESVSDLLKGNINIEDLVITKTLKTGYKNPTAITHKVLAEKITDRDPGNAPVSNERIPYVFINQRELKCFLCKKNVNIDTCKCKSCMNLFCYTHLKNHKNSCIPRCRMCWDLKKSTICNVCNGGFCSKHKLDHKCSNISEKALQGDLVDTPSFIKDNNISIDYRYYLDHQIRKPVSQIFELIKETKDNDPLKQILISDNNRVNKVRSITDFFKKKD